MPNGSRLAKVILRKKVRGREGLQQGVTAFWSGETGRRLRGQSNPQRIAVYLLTNPSANMIGLYYLPLPTLQHEVGISREGAMKALRRLSEVEFAYYDTPSEYVWIPEMARFQIGVSLKPDDNRVKGIQKEVESHRKRPFLNAFLERYGQLFHLQNDRNTEGPTKPLRSQEQNQEQEQEQKKEQEQKESRLRAVSLPVDFTVTAEMYEWALGEHGVGKQSVDYSTECFRDWAKGKGAKKEDWVATWRNCIRGVAGIHTREMAMELFR